MIAFYGILIEINQNAIELIHSISIDLNIL